MIESRSFDRLIIPQIEIIKPLLGQDREHSIPCTSAVIFNGKYVLTFQYAKGTTVGEKIIGLPGGHNEIDLLTGEIEDSKKVVQREIGEETRMTLRINSLVSYPGNEYIENMGKNGTDKWMKMTVLYTHEFFGEPRHVQPEEGKPEWKKIDKFLSLSEEDAAPNTQIAVYDAMRHSANNRTNGIYIPQM